MLAQIALSRGTKIALSLLIVFLAAVLVWASASDSSSGDSGPSRPAHKSSSSPVGAAESGQEHPDEEPAAGSLRQRSLK